MELIPLWKYFSDDYSINPHQVRRLFSFFNQNFEKGLVMKYFKHVRINRDNLNEYIHIDCGYTRPIEITFNRRERHFYQISFDGRAFTIPQPEKMYDFISDMNRLRFPLELKNNIMYGFEKVFCPDRKPRRTFEITDFEEEEGVEPRLREVTYHGTMSGEEIAHQRQVIETYLRSAREFGGIPPIDVDLFSGILHAHNVRRVMDMCEIGDWASVRQIIDGYARAGMITVPETDVAREEGEVEPF